MPVGGNEMTKVNDILEKLRYFENENENEVTKETLTTVYENQEEITPYFIRVLERVTAEPDLIYRGEKDYALHYYSLLFLAAFREKAAFPMILKLARLNEEDLEDLFRDRKSTRLNSSHVSISYAVFCLKKKKTKKTCEYNK